VQPRHKAKKQQSKEQQQETPRRPAKKEKLYDA
jgi:hypothetical protein